MMRERDIDLTPHPPLLKERGRNHVYSPFPLGKGDRGLGRSFILFFLFFLLSSTLYAQGWKPARPDYAWAFPQDHWTKPGYRTEWWYFTGHLRAADDSTRQFGYQFTFFRVGLLTDRPDFDSDWAAQDLLMGHAAVSDLREGRRVFSELLYRTVPLLSGFNPYPDSLIAWSRGPVGTDGQWTLRWNGAAFDFEMRDDAQGAAFRLSTHPLKPMILQGPNGYSRKGEEPTAASQYYSFSRLRTEGTLSLGGRTWRVRGESWMDKEFGSNQLSEKQVGWDWFSLQLDDGREVMLYLLRDAAGRVDFARGTLVSRTGEARYLTQEAWSVRATATWKSPHTGAAYPARWVVELPEEGLRMEIVPELTDQENRARLTGGLFYWEGAVSVISGGQTVGRGYVELTGYGTKNRPGI